MHHPPAAPRRRRLLHAALWALLACVCVAQTDAPDTVTDPADPAETPTVVTPPVPAANITPAPTPAAGRVAIPANQTTGIVPVAGDIDRYTYTLLQKKAEQAIADGCTVLVIEIDTFGGRVDWALEIARYLQGLSANGIHTVAWVNTKAYSAGILIASACDEIVMAPNAQAGDCAPILPGSNLADTERAKALSPILAQFKTQAGVDTYPAYHAMCVLDYKVFLVEHPDTGERRLVNEVDFGIMVLGLSAAAAADPFKNDKVSPPTNLIATDTDRGQWVAVETLPSGAVAPGGMVHDGTSLLTIDATRAADLGLITAQPANQAAVTQHLNSGTVNAYNATWSEPIAEFLLHPVVRGLLFAVMMVAVYIELSAPGLGIGALVAGGCFLLLIGAPFLIGLASVWHLLLFLLGFLLLVVELLFAPTFGILGVVGLLMMGVGLVVSVIPSGPGGGVFNNTTPEMWNLVLTYSLSTFVSLFVGAIGIVLVAKYFHVLPVFSRLILQDTPATGDPNAQRIAGDEVLGGDAVRIGAAGTTTTGLRPSGQAEFDGHLVDVVTQGNFIDAGTDVTVIEIAGNRIVVDEAEAL